MSETNNTQERGLRKTRIGVVVSDKMDKTVTIQIKTRVRHPPVRQNHEPDFEAQGS